MRAIERALVCDWVVVLDTPAKFTVIYPDNRRPTCLAVTLSGNGGELKFARDIFGRSVCAEAPAQKKRESMFEWL